MVSGLNLFRLHPSLWNEAPSCPLDRVTNGASLPSTEGFPGHGTVSGKAGKILGKPGQFGHLMFNSLASFYVECPPAAFGPMNPRGLLAELHAEQRQVHE